MSNSPIARSLLVMGAAALAACSPDSVPTAPLASASVNAATARTYVLTAGNTLPAGLAKAVATAGGTLTASLDGAGVAVATSTNPNFASRAATIAGIQSVAADTLVRWVGQEHAVQATALSALAATPPAGQSLGSTETYWVYQWGPRAIHAPEAWATGATGAGVRVAVIDGGIDGTNPDLAPNFDAAHSASFVPGFAYNQDVGPFWHGMHVAGIIAAASNGKGIVGIAPKATIVSVKALHDDSGQFSWIIQAIYYAATPIAKGGAGANVINMSIGAVFNNQGRDAAALVNALSKATTYAYQQGVTVVVAAGNDATDFDHTGNLVDMPAQATHVLAIAATGPTDYLHGATNFDRPASYTNYGQSFISFAAPGGDDVSAAGYPYDMVLSLSPGALYFADGTSMATPAAAAVAALVIGKHGGSMSPAAVERVLRQSADDLGKPGNDDYYGAGRVNAYRAVTQ